MNLSEQVSSLELAKRLKELGISQSSLFYWFKRFGYPGYYLVYIDHIEDAIGECLAKPEYEIYSAFTVAELLDFLPASVTLSKYTGGASGTKVMGYKCKMVTGHDSHVGMLWMDFYDENPANCLAKTLIYFIEAQTIEVPK